MIRFEEAREIVRVYLNFQPLTSLCWRALYWFLLGLMVNHSKEEFVFQYVEEFNEAYAKNPASPECRLATLLRNSALHYLAEFEDRSVYARTKILYTYLNSPEPIVHIDKEPRNCVGQATTAIKPTGNWDLIDNGVGRYFWLDGEWIWYGKSRL